MTTIPDYHYIALKEIVIFFFIQYVIWRNSNSNSSFKQPLFFFNKEDKAYDP